MKVTYMGVMHARGNGKKGPYDFCQLKVCVPMRNVSNENRQVVAYGGEEQSIDLDPHVIHQFKDFAMGDQVDVEIGPNPANFQRNICTGLVK